MNLYDQFSAPMNLYFLLIACLQLWRTITPVNPITTWAPLIFVFAISATKQAVDDYRRYQADMVANARPYTVYSRGGELPDCRSEAIRVGDLVQVYDDEEVPCDLLLLKTGFVASEGVAFLETANLDGETDLKTRRARPETQSLSINEISALRGRLECEPPNAELYRFDAKLTLLGGGGGGGVASLTGVTTDGDGWDSGVEGERGSSGGHVSIAGDQLVQHGTLVRKSGWVLGVAVYTGSDTKMNQNKSAPVAKTTRADAAINGFTVAIFSLQLLAVVTFGMLGHSWAGNANCAFWYLGWPAAAHIEDVEVDDGVPSHDGSLHAHAALNASSLIGHGLRFVGFGLRGGVAGGARDPISGLGHAAAGAGGDGTSRPDPVAALGAGVGRLLMAATSRGGADGHAALHAAAEAAASGHGGHHHAWYTPLVLPLRFLLLSSMMIPISLKVTLDVVKLFYARSIASDQDMYDPHSDTPATVSNTGISEDLGRVEFILTDKTGTLTENVMTLAALSVGGTLYGKGHLREEHVRIPRVSLRQAHEERDRSDVDDARDEASSGSSSGSDGGLVSASAPRLPRPAGDEQGRVVQRGRRLFEPDQEAVPSPTSSAHSHSHDSASGRPLMHSPSGRPASRASAAKGLRPRRLSDHQLHDAALVAALARGDGSALDFLRALALCNTVAPEHINAVPLSSPGNAASGGASVVGTLGLSDRHNDLGDSLGLLSPSSSAAPTPLARPRRRCVQYASSSPDEEALVHAAARLGVALTHRRQLQAGAQRVVLSLDGRKVCVADSAFPAVHGDEPADSDGSDGKVVWVRDDSPTATYEVLHTLEFTSERKRMSVLLRRVDRPQGAGPRAASDSEATPTAERRHQRVSSDPPASPPLTARQWFGGLLGGSSGGDGGSASKLAPSSSSASSSSSSSSDSASAAPSVIDGPELVLITKGADDTVLPCIDGPFHIPPAAPGHHTLAATKGHLESLAQYGLRTLVVAARPVSQAEYEVWRQQWDAAVSEVGSHRAEAVSDACDALERDLRLLGCTAIEDQLQEGVPETIADLREAGIRFWMLTGDKYTTALQIARAARLTGGSGGGEEGHHSDGVHAQPVTLLTLRSHSADGVDEELHAALRALDAADAGAAPARGARHATKVGAPFSSSPSLAAGSHQHHRDLVLVVEGHALRHALGDHRSRAFADVALRCGTVICCRCTPAQKAALVSLVRDRGRVTLAIGDGGNDVAMIQAANVGVGLSGREGQQAARAADFSFARFRHLRPLLLVHGRWSHYRTSLVAQYTFYKSQMICLLQLAFNAACGFSGCSLLDTFSLTAYNMLFTSFTGVALALDTDAPRAHLLAHPSAYRVSQAGVWINARTCAAWLGRAVVQALGILILALATSRVAGADGASVDQPTASYVAYTSCLLLQAFTVLSEMRRPTTPNLVIVGGSLAVYFSMLTLRDSQPRSTSMGVGARFLGSPGLLAAVALTTVAVAAPFAAWSALQRSAYGFGSHLGGASGSSHAAPGGGSKRNAKPGHSAGSVTAGSSGSSQPLASAASSLLVSAMAAARGAMGGSDGPMTPQPVGRGGTSHFRGGSGFVTAVVDSGHGHGGASDAGVIASAAVGGGMTTSLSTAALASLIPGTESKDPRTKPVWGGAHSRKAL